MCKYVSNEAKKRNEEIRNREWKDMKFFFLAQP